MSKIIKEVKFGEQWLRLETGEIARQATASVLVSMGDSVVLVSLVVEKEAKEARDFFPLTVHYQERYYSAGKIPGGFLKREGRPSENETLVSRLIDRPLRPLFPEGFVNEVQVIATVLSLNPEVNPDILAMVGASAAIKIAGIPFNGPIAAARVGYQDGIYLLNPSATQLATSALDLVVAGTEKAILMVESEAQELSEDVMLGAVLFGHNAMQPVIAAINEMAEEVGNPPWQWETPVKDETLEEKVSRLALSELQAAYLLRDKQQRYNKLKDIRARVIAELMAENESLEEQKIAAMLATLEKRIVRSRILAGEPRIDGRDLKTVRPISIRTGLLPRAHGSSVFTRGETQAIVAVTLGNDRDAQLIDAPRGESKDRFMLHYNFPPYSVGEIGMVGSPKRREIGHGRLAKRGMGAVMPHESDFPYVIRVVSEITESNGSSSMATVCGTSLALMDAGIPIKSAVSGIAMGLIKEGEKFAVLTDILGDEDHLGDMDFKVAGTKEGVTALQMDIKIDGITKDIMQTALSQAQQGRLHILEVMNRSLENPRDDISQYAPRIHTLTIDPQKIRDVIGKGGSTVREITETTGVNIDISEDGVIKIFSPDAQATDRAVEWIKQLTEDVKVGAVYEGKVVNIVDFGAFISVLPGKEGLLHISEISHERVGKVADVLSEGQKVTVKVIDVDRQGRIKLSKKALD